MTKLLLITCASLSLLISGCATHDQKRPTPLLIEQAPPVCQSLVPCRLPGRPALKLNEDPYRALDEVEGALTECATQVIDCIKKQAAEQETRQQRAPPLAADSRK